MALRRRKDSEPNDDEAKVAPEGPADAESGDVASEDRIPDGVADEVANGDSNREEERAESVGDSETAGAKSDSRKDAGEAESQSEDDAGESSEEASEAEDSEENPEEKVPPRARVAIDNSVYIEIAHREASSIPGIVELRGGIMDAFHQRSGIRLDAMDAERLHLSLRIHVEYGPSIPKLAKRIRKQISKAIYHMTGRIVDRIDIYVDHILIGGERPPMEDELPDPAESEDDGVDDEYIDF